MSSVLELSSTFAGRWFDGRSAVAHPVRFSLGRGELSMQTGAGDAGGSGDAPILHRLASLRIAEPLHHAPRVIDLPDGSLLEVDETPALAAALAAAGHRESPVVVWQRAWPAALIALLLLVAGSIWLYVDGLPRAADWMASRIPPSLEERMGRQALEALDQGVLRATGLAADEQESVRARIAAFEAEAGLAPSRLVFRSLDEQSAINAFSLPGGTIVLLDGLVDFTEKDPEMLMAVLAHESGHQAGRHMIRALFRGLGGASLAGLLWGSYSSVASHALILAGQLNYSRDDENEADEFAIAALRRAGISPAALSRFFRKLEAKEQRRGGGFEWMSTHPDSGERADRADEAAEADREAASAPAR